MRSLREKAHADGVAILQVFCDEHDIETPRLLIESGFKELALMVFLERRVSVRDRNLSPAQDIGWVGYSPELNKDFADTVESTFEGTLDCPNLPRWSSASETLAGWRRRGTFDPGLWWLARVDGEYAGCLLLTHYPERERFEVTYVGVVPKRRGRGLGRKMMEKGLFEIAGRHAKSVLALAVDAQNSPAVRMYESLGFTVAERRKVFFSLLAQPSRSR
jgi:ribosomal protein S18 acetylase RimI-like enzyme